jgi:NTP pyrophosphatase (non-canonical NTP hydrolase)
VAIESGELQELMLWKTDEEVQELTSSPEGKQKIAAEIADILIFSLLFCDAAAIDPEEAIRHKLSINAEKYPVNLARNNAKKYTDLK